MSVDAAVAPDLLQRARAHMQAAGLDAWAVCDFRGSNPVLASALTALLGTVPHLTRRAILVVPAAGAPVVVAHAIEAGGFGDVLEVRTYRSHAELAGVLGAALGAARRVAIEYSPGGQVPAVSWVDAGTVELLRGLDATREWVTSADLLQAALAQWADDALAAHREAAAAVVAAKDAAFAAVAAAAAGDGTTEHEVQALISQRLVGGGFETDHPAIVGANAHSGDPHYAPSAAHPCRIGAGDWVLIDLWARRPGPRHIYADITWVAVAASRPTREQQTVFDIVRRARDHVLSRLQDAWRAGQALEGWQLDRVARDVIAGAGYGDHFPHRTGHSLSPGPTVHGLGANLDDLESRDTRTLLPGTGFTVEPGIYLPDFGVRLEVDVYVDPGSGPEVTTPIQDAIVLLD